MSRSDVLLLFVLGAIWGASYLFYRIAGAAFGSIWLIALRVSLSALGLLAYAAFTGRRFDFRGAPWRWILLGAVNAGIPFMLIAYGVHNLNASISSILNSFTPTSTAIVAAIWLGERLTPRKILGLSLGLCGVAVLVGWNPLPLTTTTLFAVGACLAATLTYGIGTVYSRVGFAGEDPLTLATGQQIGALLLPLALTPFASVPSPTVQASLALVALSLLCTSVAYLIFYRLVRSVGPGRTSLVTFLVPGFSVLWGTVVLGEPVNAGMLLGMALILGAVTLITRTKPGF